ncbi:MAG: chromate transporter [Chthoniobacterales bacterium]
MSNSDVQPAEEKAATPSKSLRGRASLWEIFITFLFIGGTSFGGGVVAYLRNSLVTTKAWLDEDEFMSALEISQALPGLNATNMSVIVGDRLYGPIGALIAFAGMTLPGVIIVLLLAAFYMDNSHNVYVTGMLKGVGAASVGVLLAVTLQIGRKQLEHTLDLCLIVLTLVLISILKVSLILVLITIIPLAMFFYRPNAPKRAKLASRDVEISGNH